MCERTTAGACVLIVCHLTLYMQERVTALYMASQKGHCEVVQTLLEAKADANLKTNVSATKLF